MHEVATAALVSEHKGMKEMEVENQRTVNKWVSQRITNWDALLRLWHLLMGA
jgi:hypothetical protein